jgi:transglutaminase-like putative cysteine protease
MPFRHATPAAWVLACLFASCPAAAGAATAAASATHAPPPSAPDTGTDPSLIVDNYTQHFVVARDGAYTLTVDHAKIIVDARAIAAHSQYTISYNSTLDEVSEVRATTEKADGRRVVVTAEQIKDQQEAASSEAPMFQDTRVKIIVFPDVAAGDRLVVHYQTRRRQALFPGQFEDLSSSAFFVNKQFRLIYDMPEDMPLYADAAGFAEQPQASPPGRRRYQWQYVGGANDRIEADSVNYLDYGKRLAVSTLPDYPALARAYDARARAMAVPDQAITLLARALTARTDDPRARALALADWVRRHIRYVAVYIGDGGVVPHSAATVLAKRYGDCKDHTVLLEALLGAVGIDSSAALVNSGSAYRLPRVPTLGIFNHIITYIPALDLFLDPTAEAVAAGYLPAGVMGKPALLVKTGTLKATPATQAERSRTTSWFTVDRAGNGSFRVAKTSGGASAELYRQAVRESHQAEREQFVQRMLTGIGHKGDGVFDAGLLDDDGDDYRMRFSGTSAHFANLPGATGLATIYSFWGGLADAVGALGQETARKQDFVCPGIDSEDELAYVLQKGVRIIALPKSLTLKDANFAYRASYARKANTVTIKRSLRFVHAGAVCTPADFRRMRPLVDRMQRDLKSQVIVSAN